MFGCVSKSACAALLAAGIGMTFALPVQAATGPTGPSAQSATDAAACGAGGFRMLTIPGGGPGVEIRCHAAWGPRPQPRPAYQPAARASQALTCEPAGYYAPRGMSLIMPCPKTQG